MSVPPGQQRVEDANTGSDRPWLAGDLVCFGWLPVLRHDDSASHSWGRGSLGTSEH